MHQTEEEKIFEYTGYRREDFSVCLGCRICASVCSLNDVGANVNPQDILLSIFLRKMVDDHPLIRLCTSCYKCTDSCPWGIRIPEVIRAIREISKKEENFGKALRSSIELFGRVYEPYVVFRIMPYLLKNGYWKFFPRWTEYMSFHLPRLKGSK